MESAEGENAVAITNEGEGSARFQRAPGAKASRVKGTGLGLYITRELVEAHGGRLTVESAPGTKTRFRFTLPTDR